MVSDQYIHYFAYHLTAHKAFYSDTYKKAVKDILVNNGGAEKLAAIKIKGTKGTYKSSLRYIDGKINAEKSKEELQKEVA